MKHARSQNGTISARSSSPPSCQTLRPRVRRRVELCCPAPYVVARLRAGTATPVPRGKCCSRLKIRKSLRSRAVEKSACAPLSALWSVRLTSRLPQRGMYGSKNGENGPRSSLIHTNEFGDSPPMGSAGGFLMIFHKCPA